MVASVDTECDCGLTHPHCVGEEQGIRFKPLISTWTRKGRVYEPMTFKISAEGLLLIPKGARSSPVQFPISLRNILTSINDHLNCSKMLQHRPPLNARMPCAASPNTNLSPRPSPVSVAFVWMGGKSLTELRHKYVNKLSFTDDQVPR